MMDKLTIIRSMTSPLGEHNFGTHYLMTGYKPTPALEYPTWGATVAHVREAAGVLPPNVAVPSLKANVTANGFLPTATAPFIVGGNPDRPDFKVRDLDFYNGLDLTRLDRRRKIVRALDSFGQSQSATPVSDPDLERAYNLVASTRSEETPSTFRQNRRTFAIVTVVAEVTELGKAVCWHGDSSSAASRSSR